MSDYEADMGKGRRLIVALLLFLLPTRLAASIVRPLGARVAESARVGFSLLMCKSLMIENGARTGHMNLINAKSLSMGEDARIGHMNVVRGPIDIRLEKAASIGNRNVIARAPHRVTVGDAQLRLDEGSRITAEHSIDCAASVTLGRHSIIAGKGSQIWTHGYVHALTGPGRYRIDGAMIGAGVSVTRDLLEPGYYVSGLIRQLPRPAEPESRDNLERVVDDDLVETVYRKSAKCPGAADRR